MAAKSSSVSITAGCSAWTGTLRSQPGEAAYARTSRGAAAPACSRCRGFDSYRDLNFICFDKNVESLSDYLGPVREYLDLICDQAETEMTIVGGTQEYSMRANWKLLTENTALSFADPTA